MQQAATIIGDAFSPKREDRLTYMGTFLYIMFSLFLREFDADLLMGAGTYMMTGLLLSRIFHFIKV